MEAEKLPITVFTKTGKTFQVPRTSLQTSLKSVSLHRLTGARMAGQDDAPGFTELKSVPSRCEPDEVVTLKEEPEIDCNNCPDPQSLESALPRVLDVDSSAKSCSFHQNSPTKLHEFRHNLNLEGISQSNYYDADELSATNIEESSYTFQVVSRSPSPDTHHTADHIAMDTVSDDPFLMLASPVETSQPPAADDLEKENQVVSPGSLVMVESLSTPESTLLSKQRCLRKKKVPVYETSYSFLSESDDEIPPTKRSSKTRTGRKASTKLSLTAKKQHSTEDQFTSSISSTYRNPKRFQCKFCLKWLITQKAVNQHSKSSCKKMQKIEKHIAEKHPDITTSNSMQEDKQVSPENTLEVNHINTSIPKSPYFVIGIVEKPDSMMSTNSVATSPYQSPSQEETPAAPSKPLPKSSKATAKKQTSTDKIRTAALDERESLLKHREQGVKRREAALTQQSGILASRERDVKDLEKYFTSVQKSLKEEEESLQQHIAHKVTHLDQREADLSKRESVLLQGVNDLSKRESELLQGVNDLSKRESVLLQGVNDLSKRESVLLQGVNNLSKRESALLQGVNDLRTNENLISTQVQNLQSQIDELQTTNVKSTTVVLEPNRAVFPVAEQSWLDLSSIPGQRAVEAVRFLEHWVDTMSLLNTPGATPSRVTGKAILSMSRTLTNLFPNFNTELLTEWIDVREKTHVYLKTSGVPTKE